MKSVDSYLVRFSCGPFRVSGAQKHGGLMSSWAAWQSQHARSCVRVRIGWKIEEGDERLKKTVGGRLTELND